MKFPEIKETAKYTGLYIVDFGNHSSVGFTANEVAELLESEQYSKIKIYKIYYAAPDGKIEIIGVNKNLFLLESGLSFYYNDKSQAAQDFETLSNISKNSLPPARAKLHLSQLQDNSFVLALIYPAEYDSEFSRWLLDNKFFTDTPARGGTSVVSQYYDSNPTILKNAQLHPLESFESKTGQELFASVKLAFQR